MKQIIIGLIAISTSIVSASSLDCKGGGSIDRAIVKSNRITVTTMDEQSVRLNAFESLESLAQGKNGSAVVAEDLSAMSAGGILKAGILKVTNNGRKAVLAMDGDVHFLDCKLVK